MKRKMYKVLIDRPMFAELLYGDVVIYDPVKGRVNSHWRKHADPNEPWWAMPTPEEAIRKGYVKRI